MNRIIIIGNGFDLAHGLKTSFYDFIGNYLKKIVEKLWKDKYFEDTLLKIKIITNQSGIEKINIKDNVSIIDFFVNKVNSDAGFRVLVFDSFDSFEPKDTFNMSELLTIVLRSIHENKGWVDIEQDYFDLINSKLTNYKDQKHKNKEEFIETIQNINSHFYFLKEKLLTYIEEATSYELKASVQLLNQFKESNKRKDYIRKVSGKKPTKLYFLNFNYTNTLQPYLFCLNDDEQHELNHIHGSLCTKHGLPIFGYADDLNQDFKDFEEVKINELYDNIKTFAYNDEANYANLMRTLNEGDYQVAIYGHSCGLSDRTLLNRIFEHDNCRSIKIFYYKNGEIDDFKEKRYAIYRLFEDKTLLNDRLVNKKDSEPMVQPEKVNIEEASSN